MCKIHVKFSRDFTQQKLLKSVNFFDRVIQKIKMGVFGAQCRLSSSIRPPSSSPSAEPQRGHLSDKDVDD